MYAYKNINYTSLNKVCFVIDVINLLRKMRDIVNYKETSAIELIRYINEIVIKNSEESERYLDDYGSCSIVGFETKAAFSKINGACDVYHINSENDLMEQIESFLDSEEIIERIGVSVKEGKYSYETYSNDIYKFLKELSVDVFPIEMLGEVRYVENTLEYSSWSVEESSCKYVVRFGEFKIVEKRDEGIKNFIKDSEKNPFKMDILKFYLSLYLALSENAELVGMKICGGGVDILAVAPMSGPKSLSFCRNKVEAVVMMYLLRDYMMLEER